MVTIADFRESQYPIVSGTRCIQIIIPDDDTFKSLLAGLLALPGVETNYVGDDPDQAAALAQQWINAYIDTDWDGCATMTLPIGTILQFAAASLPDGFLYCNGDELLKADYPDLWDTIGTLWGTATLGSDYFVVPDFRNRSTYGYDYGASPPHFAFASAHGEETTTLTTTQIPAHAHEIYPPNLFTGVAASGGSGYALGGVTSGSHVETGNAGGGDPHNNLSPVAICGFIIYAGV